MRCLKHKSGVIVRTTNQVAAHLLKGGKYTPSTKGAYKRQQKLLAKGRITIDQVKPRRSMRDRITRPGANIRRDRR